MGVSKRKNMKTLKHDELASETKTISFPIEIIQEILSRLPVKPLLQFRSVSKQWLSLISNDPSFHKLHSTRSTATALFMIVYDKRTRERHFFSAPRDGGPLTHLITLKITNALKEPTEAQHLNGLILYTSSGGYAADVYTLVLNPSTRHVYRLNLPEKMRMYNFFGFDELKNEHKILNIRFSIMGSNSPKALMLFSLSDYSWKKIDMRVLPYGINWGDWFEAKISSVCINSVIHLMLERQNVILAFDLRTETFSTINIPAKMAVSHEYYLINLDGFLGVYHYGYKVHLWMLKDYENRVWVKRTDPLSKTRTAFWYSLIHSVNTNQILFSPLALKKDVTSVPVYDMKTKRFRSIQLTLGHEFRNSDTLHVHHAGSYVESNLPLKRNIRSVTLASSGLPVLLELS